MKSKAKYILILLSFFALLSCSTKRLPIKEVPLETKERIVERLVEVQAPADSASLLALLECNEKNQVILKNLEEAKSKGATTGFSLQSGLLSYKLKTNPVPSFAKVRDSIVYREVAVKVPVEVKVNYVTFWQKLQMWGGRIFLIVALFLVVKNLIVQR